MPGLFKLLIKLRDYLLHAFSVHPYLCRPSGYPNVLCHSHQQDSWTVFRSLFFIILGHCQVHTQSLTCLSNFFDVFKRLLSPNTASSAASVPPSHRTLLAVQVTPFRLENTYSDRDLFRCHNVKVQYFTSRNTPWDSWFNPAGAPLN